MLRDCVGIPIFTDSGWTYVIALLPEYDIKKRINKYAIPGITLNWINQLKLLLRDLFVEEIPRCTIRQTLDKNNLNDLKKVFILPGDNDRVLEIFQQCFDTVAPPQGFRTVLFSYRFGEKNRAKVNLPIKNSADVSRVCVHAGVSIEGILEDDSLFWSRTGIESVIGKRGSLTTACSLYECANFQSNLDGKALDISGELRRVCGFPEKVHFVQLYADLPHCYPKCRYHPVSAAIILGSGLKAQSPALIRDANTYLSEMCSNFLKLTNSVCRLEFVLQLPEITKTVSPSEFISMDNLLQLLSEQSLVVPFTGNFIECLGEIGTHLTETLKALFDKYKGTCCSDSVWKTYQYELALEKLLWGRPLCRLSNQYAVNLGHGIAIPSRCVSDQFGFLRLEHHLSCCADEKSMPPLKIFSSNEAVQGQIKKIFGFSDYLDGSEVVLGRKLVEIVLQDLFEVGSVFQQFGTFLSSLKDGQPLGRVVGVVSKATLAEELSKVEKCKFPMVYGYILRMLRHKEKCLKSIILKGIVESNLCHFPAFRSRDESRNVGMFWSYGYGVWAIRYDNQIERGTTEFGANLYCALVVTELERRKLCFTRSLTGTSQNFPWVKACLCKLAELKLDEQSVLMVLTFVTCVAFLEQARFVDYNKLSHLEQQMPLSQSRLRELEILGKFLVNNMNKFRVWRLHPSTPHQALKTAQENIQEVNNKRPRLDESSETSANIDATMMINEHEQEDLDIGVGIIKTAVSRHLPGGVNKRWSSDELPILAVVREQSAPDTSLASLYANYQA